VQAPSPHRSILVPLDGSAHAEAALGAARTLLERALADHAADSPPTLHLLSVVEPLSYFLPGDPMISVPPPDWMEAEVLRARKTLENHRLRIETEIPGIHVHCHVVEGAPAPELLRLAEELAVDLMVMATQGKGAVARAWLGSVADRVARSAPCPVLLLPPGVAPLDLDSILVPLDGSELADAALPEALRLATSVGGVGAGHPGGRLNLVSVIPRPHSLAVPYVDLSAETERYRMALEDVERGALETRADGLRALGFQVDTKTIRADEVAPGLVRLVGLMRAGVVVMTSAGRGGVARWVIGSVATRMLRITPVPVLLVPRV
jgi:nucleotide-binding universal stress UspA family protein